MKKLLSATLILVMVLSSLSFAFGTPNTWGFSDPSDLNKLQAYDKDSEKWENGHISGYKELEYVWFRYVSGDNTTTQYAIEFDYYESGRYGYDEVVEDIDFYTEAGASIDMSGKYDVDVDYPTVGSDPEVITLTVTLTDTSELSAPYAMNFEARLAGPGQASQYPGGSLHARMAVGGNEEVSIDAPPYGTLDVTKVFVGGEPWEEVTIHCYSDYYDYAITLGPSEWNGIIPNVEPGDYTVSENPVLSGWTPDYDPQIVTITKFETQYVTVTNTYEPPVVTSGSVQVDKIFIGGSVPTDTSIVFNLMTTSPEATVATAAAIYGETTWTAFFTDVYPGEYKIEEQGLPSDGVGEWQTYVNPSTFDVISGQTAEVEVMNSYFVIPPTTGTVVVEKTFVGATPATSTSVVFELWKTDPMSAVATGSAFWDGEGWSVRFEYMEADDYTVVEQTPEGWTSVVTPASFTLEPGETEYVHATNTWIVPTPGSVMFHKYFEFVDPGTTPESVTLSWGSLPVVITGEDEWTTTRADLMPASYYLTEESPGAYWDKEIWYVVGSLGEASTPEEFKEIGTYLGEEGYVPIEADTMTHVFLYNTYEEETVEITKTVEPTSHYTGGGPVTYTVAFENTGPVTYDAFWVEDHADWFIPEDAYDFASDMDGVPITTDGDLFFNEGPHDIPFGPGSVVTATWKYDSSGLGVGTYENNVTGTAYHVYCTGALTDLATNGEVHCEYVAGAYDTDEATLTIRRRSTPDDDDPGVRIEKTVEPDEASVGDTVTFTIEVTNNGDVSLTDVLVVDELIDVEWDIGTLGRGDSITETFEYVLEPGDFENGVFENIAEVTADSREGRASDTDDAVVDEETIDVPPVTPPVTPPEVIVPPTVPPQSLPQTGQAGTGVFYGLGSLMLVAGIGLGQKKRR